MAKNSAEVFYHRRIGCPMPSPPGDFREYPEEQNLKYMIGGGISNCCTGSFAR